MDVRFDHGPFGEADWFRNPAEVIRADKPEQVASALAAIDSAQARGRWLAGYCSYELGYVLEPRLVPLMPENRRLPLINFGVYDAPGHGTLEDSHVDLYAFEPVWNREAYRNAFDKVHQLIRAGDIYQANLTFPIRAEARGGSQALYSALMAHQPVGYGALIEQEGLPDILCRSPSCFFAQTRPVKSRPCR